MYKFIFAPINFILIIFLAHQVFGNVKENLLLPVHDFSNYEIDEFKSELELYDVITIFFYAPFCSHCVQSLPKFVDAFKKAQIQLSNHNPSNPQKPKLAAGKIDCATTISTHVCDHFAIKGYPTIMLFRFGQPYDDFKKQITVSSLVNWFSSGAYLISQRFTSFQKLQNQLNISENGAVVALFENTNDINILEIWSKSIREVKSHWNYREVHFYHIFDQLSQGSSSQLLSLGFSDKIRLKFPVFIIHRPHWLTNKYEKQNVVYPIASHEDLAEWIKRKMFGFVQWRTRDNEESIKPPLIVAYYDFDFKIKPAFSHKWRSRMLIAAQKYRNFTFAISSSIVFRKYLRKLGLPVSKQNEAPLIIAQDQYGVEYQMTKQFTNTAFEEFLTRFSQGLLRPIVRQRGGDKVPNHNIENHVRPVSNINFGRLITINPHDSLLLLFVNWCKHAKAMREAVNETALMLKGEPNLDFFEMDMDKNELPKGLNIEKYPAVFLITKEKKNIKYEFGPLPEMLVSFIAKNVEFELVRFDKNGAEKKEWKTLYASKLVDKNDIKLNEEKNSKIFTSEKKSQKVSNSNHLNLIRNTEIHSEL